MKEDLTLKEKLHKVSGLVLDIDKMIAEAQTDEDKIGVFNHVAWHMPRGIKNAKDTDNGAIIREVLTEVADNLGIDPAVALEFDGELSARDEDLLSSIELETEEETPEIKPTEPASTEAPEEKPTEPDVTETPITPEVPDEPETPEVPEETEKEEEVVEE